MKFYSTVSSNNEGTKYRLEFIDKAYIVACNGYDLFIYSKKMDKRKLWIVTEAITGCSVFSPFSTLREAGEWANNKMPAREVVIDYIHKTVKRLIESGLVLPNYTLK